jgi:glycosyltransferase involved in cell wall biosynthesis
LVALRERIAPLGAARTRLLPVLAMIEGLDVAVVVPAFNEERHVARVVSSTPPFVDRVVVVDDASEDATSERARATGDGRLSVLRHPINRGVGAAIATGYAHAFDAGADVAVVMAGDGQMDPADLEALLAPILRDEADYVKGNRLAWPDVARRMPLTRLVGNHALSALTRAATGVPVRDSQCGYTALTRAAAARLRLDRLWPRYGYPNDLIASLAAAGLRVRDVPVRPVYADETSGVDLRHALFVVPYVLARAALRRASAPARPLADPQPAE